MAVTLEELTTVFDSDYRGFERGRERVQQGLKDIGNEADKTGGKLGGIGDKAKSGLASLQSGIQSIGSNLANIKAGLDIAKDIGGFFFGMAKGAADAGSEFHDLSLKTGVLVETYSGLQLQLKQSGTDMNALGTAAIFMQKNLGEAVSGNKELQRAFAALGVKDVRAALADTDGTLRTVIKSLGEMQSAGERNAAGSKVMGRGFKELSVFIADTEGELDGVIEASRQAGRVMTDEGARAADEFGDQLDALTNAATIAARNFGMELVPEITRGMDDMTTSLQSNAGQWREWGQAVADVIRGARETWDSWGGRAAQAGLDFFWNTSPVGWAVNNARFHGAQARANDPTAMARTIAGTDTAVMLSMARQWMTPQRSAGGADFFAPGAAGQKARKDELDKLKAFAKEWDFVVTSLTGGKHNKGSAHYAGRAMDVSVRGKSDQEIRAFMEAAKAAGYGVRDERVRPEGQKVWSGPHLHLEMLGKAAQFVNKEFSEQEQVLSVLARALAEGEIEIQAFTQSTTEQKIAAEYLRLGIGQLTGASQELGEAMFAQRAEQIKTIETTKEQADVYMKLLAANKAAASWFNSEDLLTPSTAVGTAQGPTFDAFDLSNVQEDQWATLREEWRHNLSTMRDEGQQIFAGFFMDLRHGFKDATLDMLDAFLSMLQAMLAQALAARLADAIFGKRGEDGEGTSGGWLNTFGGWLGGLFGGGGDSEGGIGGAMGGFFAGGFAKGGYIPPGQWGVTGEHGPEPVFGGRTGVTVVPNSGGRAPVVINFHITAPGGSIPRESQEQMARRMARALQAVHGGY